MKNYGSLLILHFVFCFLFFFSFFFFSLSFSSSFPLSVCMCMCVSHIFLLVVASPDAFRSLNLFRFRFASSFLSLVSPFQRTSLVPPYKLPEVERLACSNHYPRTGHVVARVRTRSILANSISNLFSALPFYALVVKNSLPPPPKKKTITLHTCTRISAQSEPRRTPIAAVRSHRREIKLSSLPTSRRWGEENLKLPTVPFARFRQSDRSAMEIIFNRGSRELCRTDFTSERSRRTNDENTRRGRDRIFPPTRGTTSRVSSSFPKT